MKKILDWIKIAALIILGAVIGCASFTFIVAKTLWFPNITTDSDSKVGVEMNSSSYSSWLWNKERTTKIKVLDRKNDGPNFEIILKGLVDNLRLVHSGEDFAVISIRASEWTSNDRIFILHRMPKADGKESLEYKDVPGNVLAVAPDEKSYFYITPSFDHPAIIVRHDWGDNELAKVDMPNGYELSSEKPVFFSNQNKLALGVYKLDDNRHIIDKSLIIWNLTDDTIKTVSLTKLFPNYTEGKLSVEDYGVGDLYLVREDVSVREVKIDE